MSLRAFASKPTAVYTLAQNTSAVVLPSSGSSNATGQITLTTALASQPAGTAYIYLPAGVVTAGSQGTGAGLYAVTFSSTTVCQISGTGIVTANAAYTQTTASDLTLMTVTLPAGSLGTAGRLDVDALFSYPNNANNKVLKFKATGTGGGTFFSATATTSGSYRGISSVANRGVTSAQIATTNGASFGSNSGSPQFFTLDTTADQTFTITGQLAAATDYMVLELACWRVAP